MSNAPLFYNAGRITFQRANSLRREMTQAEKILWQMLRGNKVKNFYFRRQHPIGCFIADFYCHKAKLVLEVDGYAHTTPEEKEYDANRTSYMQKLGLTVLRFSNSDVIKNTDLVIEQIEQYLDSI